ncbi:glycosyltransferase [Jiella avicenniae]|uniref:Glycosyltransferase n=1 Tax=Jiella avicenniae TaxID=2907202 RepID=A0A9X1P3L3_9HYPH|nr:glycosyltransferase [Jiella avicenniae]MCE7030810.1 glycosyltransferase [Jiella avicenniae]
MKILHVAAHLGGGVGKAHAALAEARREMGSQERHRFLLLERPQDGRFAERIAAAGCEVIVSPTQAETTRFVAEVDILQIEWWGHPRLFAFLAQTGLPAHRLALWCHVSGLAPPVVPAALAKRADRTVFTSPCSFEAANLRNAIADRPESFAVANSGFGFAARSRPRRPQEGAVSFGFLGTLDFAKLHPDIFDVVDGARSDIRLRLFGHVDPQGAVAARAAAMRHPDRIVFEGHAEDPAEALAGLDALLYLLAADHYGTGENALVEAMSLGLCPLVFANPAERAIVTHGETGIVATSIEDARRWLDWMVDNPSAVARIGAEAARHVGASHSPEASVAAFAAIYAGVMDAPRRPRDFAEALGATPAAWFAASLGGPPAAARARGDHAAERLLAPTSSKGSLGHFQACFPDDAGLAALA